jgi:hypothetical protein
MDTHWFANERWLKYYNTFWNRSWSSKRFSFDSFFMVARGWQ